MGTATLTRSQSRKARSTFSSEAIDRRLSSPLGVLLGNHSDSSSRKSTRTRTKVDTFVEKENAPPLSQNGQSSPNSEGKRLVEQKAAKKRKQSACKGANFESGILKIPVTVEHEEHSKASRYLQGAENVLRSEIYAGVDLHAAGRPSVEPTSAELQCRVSNDDNAARRTMTNDGNAARTAMVDDSDEDSTSKQAGNNQNTRVELPNTSALALVLKDYERLFTKYQKLKARRLDDVEDLYKEQNTRIIDFAQATQALIDFYKVEYEASRQQIQDANIPELMKRCKSLEKANVECRDALLQEQSNSLELRQENKRLRSLLLQHVADKNKHSESVSKLVQGSQSGFSTDLDTKRGDAIASNDQSKLVQKLLECVVGLQLSYSGDGVNALLHFQHGPTGFSFNLKEMHDVEIADVVGGGELMYQNVSVGVCKRAVEWMKEKEVIFGMDQAHLLFKRLTGFLSTGFYG